MAPNRLSDRKFGLMFAAVFFIIAAVGWYFFDARLDWALAVAAVFLTLALLIPVVLLPLNRFWEAFGHRMGLISNTVLLSVFHFIFITPVGFLMRVFGNDPMHRKIDPTLDSYFTPVGRQSNGDTFQDMF